LKNLVANKNFSFFNNKPIRGVMKNSIILIVALLFYATTNLCAQVDARMLQFPDVSNTHITFTYGGDVYIVAKSGGTAHKLTTAKGQELLARFSPDGSKIAFSGNYNGNLDVYIMPSLGGIPTRLTYHGMTDRIIDWHPDGKSVLFASSRESGKQRFSQFYKVSTEGGLPEKLTVPYGEFASYSPDASKIAYTNKSRVFRTWKRYLGGTAADIWIFDLKNKTTEYAIVSINNNELPMWHGKYIYFLSDRGETKRFNIWKFDTETKDTRQITDFKDFDINFPALGPEEIVFEAGGKLYLLNLATEKYSEVKVNIVTDESTLMAKVENIEKMIRSFSVSHDGKRALIESRGEVFSVPAENGVVVNLTNSSGVAERYPAWSPDGKYAAYWSDKSGEYELTVRDLENPSEEKKLTSYGPGYRYNLFWSPNSKMIAFVDQTMQVLVYDMDKNKSIKVDKQKWMYEGNLNNFSVSWSPDSRYLAYAKELDNRNTAIAIFDTKDEKLTQVTSGFYNDFAPNFDPDGKYLYFLTGRNFSPAYSNLDNSFIYPNTTQIAVVSLSPDTPSPLPVRNDTTSVKKDEEKKSDSKDEKEDKDKDKEKEKIVETKIDFNGFEDRLEILPPSAGNYRSVKAVKGKIVFHKTPNTGSADKTKPIMYYDFEKREEKTIVGDADSYEILADGKKLMFAKSGSFSIVDIAADQKADKKMPTSKLELTVIPREEWKQIFNDVWRFQRDFFYDKNMHGVNWNEMRKRYGKLIDNAVTRWDVNYIIGELIGELNASHTYRGGGDIEESKTRAVGYLGINWELKDGAYRVAKIIRGAQWDSEVRSPFDRSGVDVKEGDYILAVNGNPIDTKKDPSAAFEGYSEITVELTVNDKPNFTGARKVIIETLKDETRLRNLEWIESNRKRVDEATNGKIGYIYVPSTGIDGQTELVRQFSAQFDKEGLIIDERFNNGGQIPDRFIELLNRNPLAFWAVRDGQTWQWPPVANFGPKVMLINGWSGSGGDAFPDYFRKSGLGPLVGTRTWGGLIGITGAPQLIDGGIVTIPTFRMYDPDGTWFKEGHGVDPDIEVIDDPSQLAKGIDPQLERAIEEAMNLLKEKRFVKPDVPAYEVR
jgi:tricorn protease